MSMPKLGNLAPAFTLTDQNGNGISLKNFRGKKYVVLYFYPTHDAWLHRSGLRAAGFSAVA